MLKEYWRLRIKGKPTDEDLLSAWNFILEEYAGLIKTPKSESIFEAWKTWQELVLKKKTVFICIWLLKQNFSEIAAQRLFELGYDLIDKDSMNKLKIIEIEVNNLDILIDQAERDYFLVCPVTEDGQLEERTMQDYDKDLMYLSRFMGGKIIRKEKITAAEHASIVNIFIEDQERKRHGKKV